MRSWMIVLVCAAAAMPLMASAQVIVDTGPGLSLASGTLVDSRQSVAGKFTLANDATVGSVQGWFEGITPATVSAAIFSGDNVPETLLYSDTFSRSTNGWQGVSGEHWALNAGSYWVVFQSSGQNVMPFGAPNPLPAYAYTRDGNWLREDDIDAGVRIYGASPAPEPATWALMLGGFGVVGGVMRSRRKSAVTFA